MSGWDFLAGFANTLGGTLQKRQQDEQAEKLRKMQEDAAMKRDMFLAEYRAKVDAEKQAAEREATKNDVTAQFTDPETGSVYGRTKSGGTVPLHETSPEYRQSIIDSKMTEAQLKKLQLQNEGLRPDLLRAQADSARASAERARRPPSQQESKPDPLPAEIRKAYAAEIARLRDEGVEETDLYTMAQVNLYPMYGKENIQRSLGGRDSAPKAASPASASLAQASRSPTQPNAPTVEQILAEANKAIQAGIDPAKVEARMAQLMQQFGYTQ